MVIAETLWSALKVFRKLLKLFKTFGNLAQDTLGTLGTFR